MKNYYDILEVTLETSLDQIKKAYRQKAIKYHPDKNFGDKFFTEMFIDVKEAYDVLSDQNKRYEYDIKYKAFYLKETAPQQQEILKEQKRKEKEKEEQFFYDPYKPFYLYHDRVVNETPQFNPKIYYSGDPLPENIDFFKLPKNIGKIVSGFSTLTKDIQPSTGKQKTLRYLKSIGISLAISSAIIFGFSLQNPIWIGIWGLAPLGIALLIARVENGFNYINTFIGVNGFAEFKCEGSRDNIVSSFEINFNDLTDLISTSEVRNRNFVYDHTAFFYLWLNNNNVVKEVSDIHSSKEGNPDITQTNYWLNHYAERYWTVYLLDNMEMELERKGYVEFSLFHFQNDQYVKVPYIHLGIGYIKFISAKGDTTYNFNEIKRVYRKGTDLFIEHTNYEKKFIFFESGNKNGIPLIFLSNRLFFFRAMEILLGYKFS